MLIVIFFVTSSDSGSLVVDMLASGGNPNPPTWSRIFWAGTSGLLAIALLLAGGLQALQTAAILIALPFSVVMIGMAVSTVRALRVEHAAILRAERRAARAALTEHVTTRVSESISEQWEELYRPPRPVARARAPTAAQDALLRGHVQRAHDGGHGVPSADPVG